MAWQGFKEFMIKAFSEGATPSSARVVSAWLSVSSMALIWFMVRHAFYINDEAKLQVWIGGLPMIIGALATFAVSPYGVAKLTGMFKRNDDDKG